MYHTPNLVNWVLLFSFLPIRRLHLLLRFHFNPRKGDDKTKCLLGTSISSSWSNRFYSSWTLNREVFSFNVQSRVRNNEIKKKYTRIFAESHLTSVYFSFEWWASSVEQCEHKKDVLRLHMFFLYPQKVTFSENFIRQNKKPERIISSIMAALFLLVAVSSFLNFSYQIFFFVVNTEKKGHRGLFSTKWYGLPFFSSWCGSQLEIFDHLPNLLLLCLYKVFSFIIRCK